MLSIKIFSFFVLFFTEWTSFPVVVTAADVISPLVIRGEDAVPGDYPYYAQILPDDGVANGFCGGSLIAPDLVLTAAHCVEPATGFVDFIAVVGVHKRYKPNGDNDGVQVRSCTRVVLHPKYDNNTLENDVALCKLDEPVAIDESKVYMELKKNSAIPQEDEMLTVIGLGHTKSFRPWVYDLNQMNQFSNQVATVSETEPPTSGATVMTSLLDQIPDTLQTGQIPFLGQSRCQDVNNVIALMNRFDPLDINITDDMLCTWDPYGRGGTTSKSVDSCRGDSGGPLVAVTVDDDDGRIVHTQVGIVSWGWYCGITPGVYANVAHLYDWIRDTGCDELGSVDESGLCADEPATKSSKANKKKTKSVKGSKKKKTTNK